MNITVEIKETENKEKLRVPTKLKVRSLEWQKN